MKRLLRVLLLWILACFAPKAYAQEWTSIDSAALGNPVSDYPTIANVGNSIYVAYWNNASVAGYRVLGDLVVKRLNDAGTAWETVGEPLYTNSTALKVLFVYKGSTPYVVYPGDGIYPGGIKKLNAAGTDWEPVTINNTSLPGLQSTHTANIAFHNDTEYRVEVGADGYTITLTKLNAQGTAWESAAPSFAAESRPFTISVVFNGDIPYVSYNASMADGLKANVKRLNAAGTAWETVGSQNFSTSQGAGISLTDNGLTILFNNSVPYVALIPKPSRNSYGQPLVLKLNAAGTDWERVGEQSDFSGVLGQHFDITFNNNIPYIAYNNLANGRITLKRLNAAGTNWENVGSQNFSDLNATFPGIAFKDNVPFVAYTTYNGNSNVKVKTFGSSVPAPVINSFTPQGGGQGTVITINGNGFSGATSVTIGGTLAAAFNVVSDDQITATLGEGASGDIVVATPYGSASAQGYSFVPTPLITAGGSTTFATGGSVLLTASTGTGYSYQWYMDAMPITGATGQSYTATASGNYTVQISLGGYTASSNLIAVIAIFVLPPTNFAVATTSVTCKGQQDGNISITAVQNLNYTAVLTGNGVTQNRPFTTTARIDNLAAGTYQVCITVEGQPDYKQCYDITIAEPNDLSVYTAVNQTLNTINLTLDGGTNYHITLNGNTIATTSRNITLQLRSGSNSLAVTTDKLCQGVIQQIINTSGNVAPYPNPFVSTLYVNLGDEKVTVADIKIYNISNGQLVKNEKFYNQSGVIKLDASTLNNGVYNFRVSLDNKQSDFKIIKQ